MLHQTYECLGGALQRAVQGECAADIEQDLRFPWNRFPALELPRPSLAGSPRFLPRVAVVLEALDQRLVFLKRRYALVHKILPECLSRLRVLQFGRRGVFLPSAEQAGICNPDSPLIWFHNAATYRPDQQDPAPGRYSLFDYLGVA